MDNTFSSNVAICTWWQVCAVDWVGGVASQNAGVLWFGMKNNLIANRVVGYENAWWTPGAMRPFGVGKARGKVCTEHTPFGEIRDNVFHDNARFGMYLDNQFPRKLNLDDDGFLADKRSCDPFTADGKDNGVVSEIHNQFDWHNTFVGMYAAGDLQFVNYTSVNNGHTMYWKASKNFADGRLWHMKDCTFAHDRWDFGSLKLLGPAGPFTFGLYNSAFFGTVDRHGGAIQSGQHCGHAGAGGPCTVHYLLEKVDFSGLSAGSTKIRIGVPKQAKDQGFVDPVYVARDNSLGGHRSIVSKHLNGFQSAGCLPLGPEWDHGFGCSATVRRLNIWGPDAGQLQLQGLGYAVAPSWDAPTVGRNAGQMHYDSQHDGYGLPVMAGMWWSSATVSLLTTSE